MKGILSSCMKSEHEQCQMNTHASENTYQEKGRTFSLSWWRKKKSNYQTEFIAEKPNKEMWRHCILVQCKIDANIYIVSFTIQALFICKGKFDFWRREKLLSPSMNVSIVPVSLQRFRSQNLESRDVNMPSLWGWNPPESASLSPSHFFVGCNFIRVCSSVWKKTRGNLAVRPSS